MTRPDRDKRVLQYIKELQDAQFPPDLLSYPPWYDGPLLNQPNVFNNIPAVKEWLARQPPHAPPHGGRTGNQRKV